MSVAQISIVLGIFFIATIVISFVKKVNPGILGVFFSIITAVLAGLSWKQIQSGFPTNVVLTIIAVALFFGYFNENGTFTWIGKSLIYYTRNIPKLLPYIFFVFATIMGGLGGGDMVVFSVSVAFPLAIASGMKPWEAGAICLIGSQCGSYLPWSVHGSTARAVIETMNDGIWADSAMALNWRWWFTSLLAYLIVVTVYYFIFKNYKLQKVEGIEKPSSPDRVQKLSLMMICIVLALAILMPIVSKGSPSVALKSIANMCSIAPLCFVGAFVNMLLGLGKEKAIIKRVPWNIVLMVFGMGMLVNLASTLGVLDYLAGLAQNMPSWAVGPVFLLIAGIMSLFSSSLSVVYPSMLPIAGAFATTLGINPAVAMSSVVIGAATTAMSPLSTAGGMILANCPEDVCDSQTMFIKMFLMALLTIGILFVLNCLGLFGLFSL